MSALQMPSASSDRRLRRLRRSLDASAVLSEMEQLHGSMQPGDTFPSHRDLSQKFDASDRSLRWALDELVRQGKVVRRVGRGGNYVAESNGNLRKNRVLDRAEEVVARTIVAIAQPDQGFFDRALQLLAGSAEERELFLQCQLVTPNGNLLGELTPTGAQALGYLVFRHDLLPLAHQLQAHGNRVVLVGSPSANEQLGVPNVYSDQEQGAWCLTNHLLELGHRRIAFHGGTDLQQTRRWLGYARAVSTAQRKGVSIETSLISEPDLDKWREDLKLARRFFKRPNAPTAIVAWNDYGAILLLNLLNHIGLRVPEDISLVGYDNMPPSALIHPPLTTVDSAIEQQIEAALGILTAPQTPAAPQTTIVLPTLIRRQSARSVSV